MKMMRCMLAALLCYAAFWGAAHIALLPGLHGDTPPDMAAHASAGADLTSEFWRHFFVIR